MQATKLEAFDVEFSRKHRAVGVYFSGLGKLYFDNQEMSLPSILLRRDEKEALEDLLALQQIPFSIPEIPGVIHINFRPSDILSLESLVAKKFKDLFLDESFRKNNVPFNSFYTRIARMSFPPFRVYEASEAGISKLERLSQLRQKALSLDFRTQEFEQSLKEIQSLNATLYYEKKKRTGEVCSAELIIHDEPELLFRPTGKPVNPFINSGIIDIEVPEYFLDEHEISSVALLVDSGKKTERMLFLNYPGKLSSSQRDQFRELFFSSEEEMVEAIKDNCRKHEVCSLFGYNVQYDLFNLRKSRAGFDVKEKDPKYRHNKPPFTRMSQQGFLVFDFYQWFKDLQISLPDKKLDTFVSFFGEKSKKQINYSEQTLLHMLSKEKEIEHVNPDEVNEELFGLSPEEAFRKLTDYAKRDVDVLLSAMDSFRPVLSAILSVSESLQIPLDKLVNPSSILEAYETEFFSRHGFFRDFQPTMIRQEYWNSKTNKTAKKSAKTLLQISKELRQYVQAPIGQKSKKAIHPNQASIFAGSGEETLSKLEKILSSKPFIKPESFRQGFMDEFFPDKSEEGYYQDMRIGLVPLGLLFLPEIERVYPSEFKAIVEGYDRSEGIQRYFYASLLDKSALSVIYDFMRWKSEDNCALSYFKVKALIDKTTKELASARRLDSGAISKMSEMMEIVKPYKKRYGIAKSLSKKFEEEYGISPKRLQERVSQYIRAIFEDSNAMSRRNYIISEEQLNNEVHGHQAVCYYDKLDKFLIIDGKLVFDRFGKLSNPFYEQGRRKYPRFFSGIAKQAFLYALNGKYQDARKAIESGFSQLFDKSVDPKDLVVYDKKKDAFILNKDTTFPNNHPLPRPDLLDLSSENVDWDFYVRKYRSSSFVMKMKKILQDGNFTSPA